MKKIISIDHGNAKIKTTRHVFSASFVESSYLPSIGGDVLKYEDKVYILTEQSLPVLNDKTEDERYFILSLFAIGKELEGEIGIIRRIALNHPVRVELLVGLPLQHYETYKEKFARYFSDRAGLVRFELNEKSYSIQFAGVHVYPQAYAAAITAYDRLVDSRIVNIVDIGGFTVDCLQLNRFKPNMNLCTSLYWGVNALHQSINDQVRATGARDISESIIEEIIKKDPVALAEYSQERIDIITSSATTHTNRMLAEIAQKGFDLKEDKTVFVGGGAILLKGYILQANKARKSAFIDDVHANAEGYRLIYDMQNVDSGNIANVNTAGGDYNHAGAVAQ
jgi:plasmid segregation protein ParM